MKNHKKEFLRMIGLGELENHTLQNIMLGRIITGYCCTFNINLGESKAVVYSILKSAGMLPTERLEKIEDTLSIRADAHIQLRRIVNLVSPVLGERSRANLFFIYYYVIATIDGADPVLYVEKAIKGLQDGVGENYLLKVLKVTRSQVLSEVEGWRNDPDFMERMVREWSRLRSQRNHDGSQN